MVVGAASACSATIAHRRVRWGYDPAGGYACIKPKGGHTPAKDRAALPTTGSVAMSKHGKQLPYGAVAQISDAIADAQALLMEIARENHDGQLRLARHIRGLRGAQTALTNAAHSDWDEDKPCRRSWRERRSMRLTVPS